MSEVYEIQPGIFNRPTTDYEYVGFDRDRGLHKFTTADGGTEYFAKRTTSYAGWHLKYGRFYYEFCCSN